MMISTSIIFSTGEKKWMPMNSLGPLRRLGEAGDRQRRGVGGEDARPGRIAASTFAITSALTFGSSNTASIDEVAACEGGIVGAGA